MEEFGGGFLEEEEEYTDMGGGFLGGSCCEACGCLSFSQELYAAFTVMVCQSCKRNDKYKLIAKGAAKDTYSLTDGDLKRLGFINKLNPQHKQWSEMKLYLQLQVEQVALKKHGSLAALQETKRARLQARISSRVDRVKRGTGDVDPDAGGEEGAGVGGPAGAQFNTLQQRVRARLAADYEPGTAAATGPPVAAGSEPGAVQTGSMGPGRRRAGAGRAAASGVAADSRPSVDADTSSRRDGVVVLDEQKHEVAASWPGSTSGTVHPQSRTPALQALLHSFKPAATLPIAQATVPASGGVKVKLEAGTAAALADVPSKGKAPGKPRSKPNPSVGAQKSTALNKGRVSTTGSRKSRGKEDPGHGSQPAVKGRPSGETPVSIKQEPGLEHMTTTVCREAAANTLDSWDMEEI